jgi:hypothetical protein
MYQNDTTPTTIDDEPYFFCLNDDEIILNARKVAQRVDDFVTVVPYEPCEYDDLFSSQSHVNYPNAKPF